MLYNGANMDWTKKNRSGFTLVEMLVVVMIIGALVALLVPAINAARENARAAKCLNNQQELGKALLHYEGAKKHLPGVLSPVNPYSATPVVNWVMSIFGEIGRSDLWQEWQNPAGNHNAVKVGQLICPSNSLVEPLGGLSYVVNLGAYQTDSSGNPDYTQRIFRNRASVTAAGAPAPEPDLQVTSLKSAARTVMLSERLQAGPWVYTIAPTLPGDATPLLPLAFQWPLSGTVRPISGHPARIKDGPRSLPTDENVATGSDLSSNHRGMIVVTFCDGHSEKIPDTTTNWNDPENQLLGTP
jgi:prepilin-type N-terminal cleavage/methylation domain-containing protein